METQLERHLGKVVLVSTMQDKHPGEPYVGKFDSYSKDHIMLSPAVRCRKPTWSGGVHLSSPRYGVLKINPDDYFEITGQESRKSFPEKNCKDITLSREVVSTIEQL